jgi:CRISPR/Cas system CMR-associated protein Cmr3 (group 5 of RAMP superfamily)
MGTIAINKCDIYCIGGKGKFVQFKTIEKYIISHNRWEEIKMQLNYSRYFPSCCQFANRFIYIFGQSENNEMIEVLDTSLENEKIKCELLSLYTKPGPAD